MTLGQVAFMDAILSSGRDLVFGLGPTGTGKTHLAVAAGLHLVNDGHFRSLVITRPRILLEGETMTPALRSETLYDEQLAPAEDVLIDLLGHDEMRCRIDHGLIEIVPLGRLRGRTLNGRCIVVDDAQNMSPGKLRMALTRLGRGSRMVVTGDPSQPDLPEGEPCGLSQILPLIVEAGLATVHHFDRHQIVRNELSGDLRN
jgi:phosphate starvation-inducible PhoH-like protein